MDYEIMSERLVYELVKSGSMSLDQFYEYMETAYFHAVERHEKMKEFYEKELD